MSPAKKLPKMVASLTVLNGDHEIYLRLSRRMRILILAALVSLLAGGLGTFGEVLIETFRLLLSTGAIP